MPAITRTYTIGIVVAALCAAAVAGCARDQSTPPPPVTSTPATVAIPLTDSGPVAGQSPEAVAAGAMRELYTLVPGRESQGDSLRRITAWLSPAMRTRTEHLPAPPAASLQWASWVEGGARVEAATFVSAERPPREQPGTAARKVAVSQTVRWPDGRGEPLPPFSVAVTVVETGNGWRVDDYRTW
ncbi:hypothetical protein [Nocardia gipuzkoensis]|uniref:hypothetical protein n=1 Tax=Nocardia gipuzkoensis TaxID=2749991 RepID=UPI002455DDC9|nr:hypothetical protein [Nocardia gipuzkoensis]